MQYIKVGIWQKEKLDEGESDGEEITSDYLDKYNYH